METVTLPGVALLGFTAGTAVAIGWMVAYAVRTAYSITRQHHWHQLRKLRGK